MRASSPQPMPSSLPGSPHRREAGHKLSILVRLCATQLGDYAKYPFGARPWTSGSPTAQQRLGLLYQDGQGVPQDYTQAASWFGRAASQGDSDAETSLGVLYAEGHGVAQDLAQAVAWFRKGADQGSTTRRRIRNCSRQADTVGRRRGRRRHTPHLHLRRGQGRFGFAFSHDRNLCLSFCHGILHPWLLFSLSPLKDTPQRARPALTHRKHFAGDERRRPMRSNQQRIEATANSAVSAVIPTLTHPSLAVTS